MHKGKMHLRGNKKRKHIVCLENDMDFNTAKDRGPQGWQVSKSSPAGTEGDLEGIQWQHLTPILLSGKSHGWRSLIGCSPWGCWESDMTEWFLSTFHFHALEKDMATHSSVLAWRVPGTWEPGGLPSLESHTVRHDWGDLAAAAAWGTCVTCFSDGLFGWLFLSSSNKFPVWLELPSGWFCYCYPK